MPSGPKKRKAAKKKLLLEPINVQGVNGGGDDDLLSHDEKSENGDVGSPISVGICSEQCLVEERDSSESMDTGKKIEIEGSENGVGESVKKDGEGLGVIFRDVEVKEEEEEGNLTSIKLGFESKIIHIDTDETIQFDKINLERELEKPLSSSLVMDRFERIVSEEVNRVAEALGESPDVLCGVHFPWEENEVEILLSSDSLSGKIGESRLVEITSEGELEKPMSEILVMDPPVDWSERIISLLEEGDRVIKAVDESPGSLNVVHFPLEENEVEIVPSSDSLSGQIGESRSFEITPQRELEKPGSEIFLTGLPVDRLEQVVSLMEEGNRVTEASGESSRILGIANLPSEDYEEKMVLLSDSQSRKTGESQSVEVTSERELEEPVSSNLNSDPPIDLFEPIVFVSEEVTRATEASGKSPGVLGIVNLPSEYNAEVRPSLENLRGKSGDCSEFCEGSCNLESSENMERKPLLKSIQNQTSWKSCCGLFDVLMGGHK